MLDLTVVVPFTVTLLINCCFPHYKSETNFKEYINTIE